jgi:hypothetical protein
METTPHPYCKSEGERFQVEWLVELSNGTGITQEISVSEVFFVTNRLFSLGEPIEFALVLEHLDPNHPVRFWCRGQVVHAEQHDGKACMAIAIEAFRFEMHK